MLNLHQASLMIEGCLRGIMSTQEGKSFDETISFAKYIMDDNQVAKLDEEVYKPEVEMTVDGIVDILITNMEMKWTDEDIFRIEEADLFSDISRMNERNITKINNELARKRNAKQQQSKATESKVETKQQPKATESKVENKKEVVVNTRVKEIFGRESVYNALGGKDVMTFEEYLTKLDRLDGFGEEDEMKYLCEVLNDLSEEKYKEIKSDVDNAKIEMLRLTSKLGTKEAPNYDGFKSLLKDDFKVKNLSEEEIRTVYDTFIKALEDGEINDALDKALEKVNQKEQKINRENDRPKNIHEEEWKRYFNLNLKNKKRGTMKGYLYKKSKLYRDAFGGNETPNNLLMRLNDIDKLLGSGLLYDTTLTNNDNIMKAVAKYLEETLDKDNFSNAIMRDLIDNCLPKFEDIVING